MMKADLPNSNPEGHSEQGLVNQGVQYLNSSPLQSARDQLVQSQPLYVVVIKSASRSRVVFIFITWSRVAHQTSLGSNPLILRYRCCVTKGHF